MRPAVRSNVLPSKTMRKSLFHGTKTFGKCFFGMVFVLVLSLTAFAQTSSDTKIIPNETAVKTVKVTQIDEVGLKNLLKPNGRPLLVNFWATWCEPCREEFPDLVKINSEYKGKIDFITVSLDDYVDLDGDVTKFLTQMKAEMPAFLLKTKDEDAAIRAVSPDWQGALPFTIMYDANGKTIYTRMGKVNPTILKQSIDKSLLPK
jgi:thiol-disulfide isomerase/thioredoxin